MGKFDLKSWTKGFVLGLAGKTFPSVSQNAVMFAGWLMGKKITGMRKAEKASVAYLYNGVLLSSLPKLSMDYRYMVICKINSTYHQLFVSESLPYALTENTGDYLHFPAPWGCCNNNPKAYKWNDMGYSTNDYTGFSPDSVVWSNFDLYHEDGTLVCAASEPVASSWPYVIATLFDGEVTTAANSDGTTHVSDNLSFTDDATLGNSCAYRITVDGETTVEDVAGSYSLGYYLGNPYLADSENFEDNGGSWCLKYKSISKRYFYTRNAGTYQLKLESVRG